MPDTQTEATSVAVETKMGNQVPAVSRHRNQNRGNTKRN